ncbi:BZ3500_MvSof-1268-A1-R1_Chr3-3g06453 [Microbotryum saponariae]|uniref:BZ3500_MvSof-1268-A1-R1_Chr3-3g06453 protein n=1 Tax=Microbotryum saponariae TaxID=289078 RepID=A0A2X0MYI7_9BASI|nr:BZ3500_MvSof-1268-A1-R1_Chr3-3g06453 [Microbotryum saponariae]SDA04420.1 BZ3501_MvSof-1269-A2-R1_Chr3-2g06140 [Microbotryum saponariae]
MLPVCVQHFIVTKQREKARAEHDHWIAPRKRDALIRNLLGVGAQQILLSNPEISTWQQQALKRYKKTQRLGLDLLDTLERPFLGRGLEATVTEFGTRVDELERDLLGRLARGVGDERLAQGQDALLDTDRRALDDNKVVLNDTVSDKATEGVDRLLRDVEFGRTRRAKWQW